MGAHRKSLIREALERLDGKMATGQSRYAAKRVAQRTAASHGETLWTVSTGKIHSHQTRRTYQQQVLAFVNWARDTHGILNLQTLDERADELASCYLESQIQAGKSPWTLQTARSALRLFFDDRQLGSQVQLPARRRENIRRSRQPVAHDRHVQPDHWESVLAFERAVGLRSGELRRIRVGDISQDRQGTLVATVHRGKGGKSRQVPVLPGHEADVLAVVAGRPPQERIFARLPDMDMQALRREYAQALYLHHAKGRALPPQSGRVQPTDYDAEAVRLVSRALGHERLDVVLTYYLR
jgi:integrase